MNSTSCVYNLPGEVEKVEWIHRKHVLVVVLVHLVSFVVLVLDEIAVVVDPFLIAVSMVATSAKDGD